MGLTNLLAVPCTFFGFVGAERRDANDDPLPSDAVRDGGPLLLAGSPRRWAVARSIQGSNIKVAGSNLTRWAGVSAVVAGVLFVFIQPIHPPELLSSVTTDRWVVHGLSVAMCCFWLLGITGIYARQVEEAGWLGLAGFLVSGAFLVLTAAFTFAEAVILPPLATAAPMFVEGFLGVESGSTGGADLGAVPALYTLSGVLYLLGGVLFGVATFRAGILPRWAAGLLAVGTVLPLAVSLLLPHQFLRLAAVPVGVALACLGYALWSERREHASEPIPDRRCPQLRQTGAE